MPGKARVAIHSQNDAASRGFKTAEDQQDEGDHGSVLMIGGSPIRIVDLVADDKSR